MVDKSSPTCSAETREGKPCSARPRPGSDRCPWHDADLSDRRREWSAKGGKSRSHQARARKQLAGDIHDMSDVKVRLMVALSSVEAGKLDPGPANAMANLARAIATVAGVADFEGQLAELRHEVAALSEQRGA
jgi:hypothetical protein